MPLTKILSLAFCLFFFVGVAKKRSDTGSDSGTSEYENTLNAMLAQMDGTEQKKSKKRTVIVIGATNRAHILDQALLRSNRLERTLYFTLPTYKTRLEHAHLLTERYAFDDSITPEKIASWTSGMNNADIEGLLKQAQRQAHRKNLTVINDVDLNTALDLVTFGEPSNIDLSDAERRITAHHEAGHALTMLLLNGPNTIRRATIEPRGEALGSIAPLPPENSHMQSLSDLLCRLIVCLAGRSGEKIMWNHEPLNITTGASGDIVQANMIASNIIDTYGFDQESGLLTSLSCRKISENSTSLRDQRITDLMHYAQHCADKILAEHKDAFLKLTEHLLKDTTLTQNVINIYAKESPKTDYLVPIIAYLTQKRKSPI